MAGKDVHVKSYTRDGEKVREHWRSRPDSGIDDVVSSVVKQAVLRGGVEHTDISLDSIVDVIRDIANKGKDAWNKIPKPIKTVLTQALIQSVLYNPSSAANARVVSGGQRLQNTSAEAKQYPIIKDNKYNIHKYKNNSNNIVKPEEKYSYIKKYKEPQLQKPNSQLRKKIENSRRNEEIYKLLNLSTNKLIKINDTALEALPKMLFNPEYFNIDNTAFKKELTQKIKEFNFEKTIFNIIDNNPYISKNILEIGSNIGRFTPINNASELLQASIDFKSNTQKMREIIIIDNYQKTGHLASIVKEKLIKQNMNPESTPGIIFTFNNEISKKISQSKEIKYFAKQYKKALEDGMLVSKDKVSIRLTSTKNLQLAINNADILFAYYDQNENQKNLIMVLLDTYDFNKGENILVELGRSPQEAGILDGYFSLFFVLVPSSLLKE